MDKLHKTIRVFVSYTGHDTDTNTVRAFVDHLRSKGYDAVMDTYLLEEHYSNLYKMMVSEIQTANKVIIILSPEYTDVLQAGVCVEVKTMLEDYEKNKEKYILVTFWDKDELPLEHIEKIQPSIFKGDKIYPLSKSESSLDRIFSLLAGVPEVQFHEVAPKLYVPKSKKIAPFLDTGKKSDRFGFSNLHIHSILRFEANDGAVSYEVFRCLKVTSGSLPELQIRPQFNHNSPVQLSSYLANLPEEIEMDDQNFAKFMYPLPPDNKSGDIVQVHYKMNLQYPTFGESKVYYLLSENDSQLEIHDIVLEYTDDAPDATLLKKSKTDLTEQTVRSVAFDKFTRTYRFILTNPELGCTYILRWKDGTEMFCT